ncbi:hypothetical protein ABPG75_008904 [Micractinium tetrahymenae]
MAGPDDAPTTNGPAAASGAGANARLSKGELVVLNVGGKLFTTTRTTLTHHPHCMLAGMFRGDIAATHLTDAEGHPFHFPSILAFLRDSAIPPLPESRRERQELAAEAAYYSLAELVEALQAEEEYCAAAEAAEEERLEAERYMACERAAVLKDASNKLAAAEAALEAADAALNSLKERVAEARRLCREAWEAHARAVAERRPREQVVALAEAVQRAQHSIDELATQLQVEGGEGEGARLARHQAQAAVDEGWAFKLAALGMQAVEVHQPGAARADDWPGDAAGPALWEQAQQNPGLARVAEAACGLWRERQAALEARRRDMQRLWEAARQGDALAGRLLAERQAQEQAEAAQAGQNDRALGQIARVLREGRQRAAAAMAAGPAAPDPRRPAAMQADEVRRAACAEEARLRHWEQERAALQAQEAQAQAMMAALQSPEAEQAPEQEDVAGGMAE